MLLGFHHVTAIAGDPRCNLDFYTGFLGLRLVKRTVNFDDPSTHHFYFGDRAGAARTLVTFFPWASSVRKTRPGAGQIVAVAFAAQSLDVWKDRAHTMNVPCVGLASRRGRPVHSSLLRCPCPTMPSAAM